MASEQTNTDVVVIGGGPAGSTVSTLCAQHGLRVKLYERDKFPRFHIGESLIPETYWVFKRLNMLDKMKASPFVKKYSVQFVSASGKMSAPFYFHDNKDHECSQTWQVIRSQFDQMMLDNAREHGVAVRPVDINASDWDNLLEADPASAGGRAVRLGFRQVKGVPEDAARRLVAARGAGYADLRDLHERAGLARGVLEKLATADACRGLGLDRRAALWAVKALPDTAALPLFAAVRAREEGADPAVALPPLSASEEVVDDYQSLRLSLRAHPLSFLRDDMAGRGLLPTAGLADLKDGDRAAVAGIVIVRQRPGSAKGVIFMTLEDETGIANAVVWPKTFEPYRKVVMGSRMVMIRGRIQRSGDIIHLIAAHLEDWSAELLRLSEDADLLHAEVARADEVRRPGRDPVTRAMNQARGRRAGALPPLLPARHPRALRDLVPKSRDFH